jgi:Fe-S-cluster-containing dehydrogenase component
MAQPGFTVRGMESYNVGNASLESGVQVVVDGIPLTKAFMMTPQIYDLERVEIMRGPQGTTFGRNATLGLAHFITAQPSQDYSASSNFSAGTRGLLGFNGHIGGGLSDTVSVRVAANYKEYDGSLEDENTGESLEGAKGYGLRASMLFEPSDTFSAYLKFEQTIDRNDPPVRRHESCTVPVLTTPRYINESAAQPLHGQSSVKMEYHESGQWPMVETNFRPAMCNNFDDAPCIAAADNDAVKKRDDGIVIIDPRLAKGQKQIVDACPYGAIYWNEESNLPQAWPFYAHLLDGGWEQTKLETVCPTEVFQSLKISDADMQQLASDENLVTLESATKAKPRVYYKNNHLFTSCFVGGAIVSTVDGVEDCVSGAAVSLYDGDSLLGTAKSDGFGEFKISGLQRDLGELTQRVELDGAPANSMNINLRDSLYVGSIEV